MTRARSNKVKKSAQDRRNTTLIVHKATFSEHVSELRRRLFRVAASIIFFSTAAYFVQQHIVAYLLSPAKDQHFAQTTPGGGLDFLFRVCIYVGVAVSIPIIFQQVLGYMAPLIKKDARKFIKRASVASWILALAGISFGYFIGLPAALHFLLHQFINPQIETLISLQSYLSFVLTYMLGAAMLFQMPLIMLVINRITPLKPSKLFSYERWVVVAAVVLGGVLSPSPNIMDQVLLAGPMIATYQLGIFLVWMVNRRGKRPKKVSTLRAQDEAARQERLEQFQAARAALLAQKRKASANVSSAAALVSRAPHTATLRLHSNSARAVQPSRPMRPLPASKVAKVVSVPKSTPITATNVSRPVVAVTPKTASPVRVRPTRPYVQYDQSFQRRSYFTPVPGRIQ